MSNSINSHINIIDIDPYFFLGVTPTDDINFVTKMFRKKAKKLHPDKNYFSTEDEKNNSREQFQLLIQCYEYILSNHNRTDSFDLKQSFNKQSNQYSQYSSSPTNTQVKKQKVLFDELSESISKVSLNSFGYGSVSKLESKDDYDTLKPKIHKVFNDKSFDVTTFNNVFEYQKKKSKKNKQSNHSGLIHRTSDGFFGYNSGNLSDYSIVHSYNGLLLVGDDLGESGKGYFSDNYSDYKQSFESSKNPLNLPTKSELTQALKQNSNKDMYSKSNKKSYLNYKDCYSELTNQLSNQNKMSFVDSNTYFEQKKRFDLLQSIENDKKFVNKYVHLYPKQTIESANKNLLKTSTGSFDDTFNPHLSLEYNLSKFL